MRLNARQVVSVLMTTAVWGMTACGEDGSADQQGTDSKTSDTASENLDSAASNSDTDSDPATDMHTDTDTEDTTENTDTATSDSEAPNAGVCGNGVIEGDEGCDDKNTRPADGCSGICQIEPGYTCPTEGDPCELTAICGNEVKELGEACDDGNTEADDGCDAQCAVEPGWACDDDGCRQIENSVCGDGLVGVGEQCDDGIEPPVAGDGCDTLCQVETGWRCSSPGQPCEEVETEFCGNGTVEAEETCDDGNGIPGDGCSATCVTEPGYHCDADGCEVICGDGLVVGAEVCDDGNTSGDDGCAEDCRKVEDGYLCPVAGGLGGACIERSDEAVCPNGVLEFGEQCDDGNAVADDGCTNCIVDEGYRCVIPNQACELIPTCGDGYVDLVIGEQCDDGNDVATDGCDGDCQVASGFICPVPEVEDDRLSGGSCRPIVCGDGVIEGDEQCDDGEAEPDDGDGCSSTCQLEPGWTCPAKVACLALECGDGIIAGFEECDNGESNGTGDVDNGVICTESCQITPDAAACGNGTVDPGEACDDGNHDQGDGCTVFCTKEPSCHPPEPCTTECGDGIVFGDESCDDGNTRSGDGCSSQCEEEVGFTCTEAAGDELVIPVVYRDFQAFQNGGHVAFQWSPDPIDLTPLQDIWVRRTLGTPDDTMPDGASLLGKPIFLWYVECDGDGCTDLVPDTGMSEPVGLLDVDECNGYKGDDTGIRYMTANDRDVYYCGYGAQDFYTFSEWYRDVDGTNQTIVDTLTLTRQTDGAFEFDDTSFFPINDQGFGNEDWSNNFHFTSEVRYWFRYDAEADATLRFRGDDDVWVYVNGILVVDISGTHGATEGVATVNADIEDVWGVPFSDNPLETLVDGEVYEIVVFQAERNTSGSNYRLTLQDFNLVASTCESTCGDGVKASSEQCDFGDTCADGSTCTDGRCDDDSPCNDGSYGGCTKGPDAKTGCKLAGYCGDGEINGPEQCDDGLNDDLYTDTAETGCAAGCVFPPYCGDGIVAMGIEQCDGGDDCEADCTLAARCGDGNIDVGEDCDDGADNGSPASNCDASCRDKCGNGEIDAGEQCDPGVGGFSSDYDGCLPPVGDQRGCIFGPRCGDGIRNGPEECDDGLNDGSYGTCAPGCVLGTRCGDGVVQDSAGETCDEGVNNVYLSYDPDGVGLCRTICIPVRYCGDGFVSDGEGCDDGVNSGEPGSCEPDCSAWVELVTCGNGTVDPGEACDAGDQNGTAESGCDTTCRIRCGNGVRDSGEACDDGVNDGTYGTCMPDCQIADYCGDGIVNGPEGCDDGDDNQSNPYGPGLCNTACQSAPYCGDGRIQESFDEECDGQAGCTDDCEWLVNVVV